jgi:hypothetical protein
MKGLVLRAAAGRSANKVTKFMYSCAQATAACATSGNTTLNVVLADKSKAQITVQLTFQNMGKQA